MTDMTDPTNDELERLLSAYAETHLSPDPRAAEAIRARLIREAGFAFDAARDEARHRALRRVEQRARWRRSGVRYGLLAATFGLSVAFTGVALASEAGDPLYGVRVWWETALLPAGGDARASAEISRMDARLVELAAAVESGNGNGAAAAAAAYQQIVEEALHGAVGDDRRQMQLEDALSRHVEVLTALLSKVPDSARGSIEHAIVESGKAIEKVGGPSADPNVKPAPDKPARSPKPDSSARPTGPGNSQGNPGG